MKTLSRALPLFLLSAFLVPGQIHAQFFKKLKHAVQKKVEQAVSQPTPTNSKTNSQSNSQSSPTASSQTKVAGSQEAIPPLKVYQNYDFVPGDTVLFEDNFSDDQDGEFPSHWNLQEGQGVLNKVGKQEAFCLTEGNYAHVYPLMKTKSYLTDPFTVELDYYVNDESDYGINIFLESSNGSGEGVIHYSQYGDVSTSEGLKDFNANYPDPSAPQDSFLHKWHHIAIIFMHNQLKCYLDQYRVLIMPNVGTTFQSVQVGGIGSIQYPIRFRNIRIAAGGSMNFVGAKFTKAKIVTHGIKFDVDQSTIKPESMGTLNMILGILNQNPGLKFEIDGYTDNTGDATHNLTLSQQRADAVKAQLVQMGIDPTRLSTKGLGEGNPIDTNDTQTGRANNRRVEFVKL